MFLLCLQASWPNQLTMVNLQSLNLCICKLVKHQWNQCDLLICQSEGTSQNLDNSVGLLNLQFNLNMLLHIIYLFHLKSFDLLRQSRINDILAQVIFKCDFDKIFNSQVFTFILKPLILK